MLTPRQIQQYKEDGYVLVSGLFTTPELDVLEREFDGIIERRLSKRAHLDATWGGDWKKKYPVDQQIIHTHDVQAYSAAWARALVQEHFTEAFSDLLGTPNVQLHHTKLFQKPRERGAAFPMHQDQPYFPHARHSMMAGIIHLSDATLDMGCVRVYPGSHKLGPLPVFSTQGLYLNPDEYSIEKATPCPALRGDVLFFNYLTIHGSAINASEKVRKTVLVQVRDPADKPLLDVHKSHAQGMILRGIDPLEDAATGVGTLEATSIKKAEQPLGVG